MNNAAAMPIQFPIPNKTQTPQKHEKKLVKQAVQKKPSIFEWGWDDEKSQHLIWSFFADPAKSHRFIVTFRIF